MADFPTTPALLDKGQVLAATAISGTAVNTAAVATGAGVNSGAQGFETARAQGVEFFFSFTAGNAALNQLTAAVEFSADGTNWYEDDAQTVVWAAAADLPDAGDEVRMFVKMGSRLDKFVRLAFTTSTTQSTTASDVTCEARVAGISKIFTKNPQVS